MRIKISFVLIILSITTATDLISKSILVKNNTAFNRIFFPVLADAIRLSIRCVHESRESAGSTNGFPAETRHSPPLLPEN